MRIAFSLALALTLPATHAAAQAEDACLPGPQGTVSDCTLDANPPVIQDFADGEFIGGQGGAIAPERVGDPVDEVAVGGILPEGYDRIADPERYGLDADEETPYYDIGDAAVGIDPATREVLEIRPFSDLGIGIDDDIGPDDDIGVDGPDDRVGIDLDGEGPGVEVVDDDLGVGVTDDELGLQSIDDELGIDSVDEDLGLE